MMKPKFPLFIVLCLCILALSACSLPQARTATPETSQPAAPTNTAAPQRPTATGKIERPTATLAPTETPAPTATLAPLATPTWEPGCPPPNLITKIIPQNFQMPDLIGAGFFESPEALQFEAGWLIDFENTDDPTVYALETVLFEGARYLLLERVVCNEPGGKAYYLMLDVLPYPEIQPGEGFGIDIKCTLNGAFDEKILGLALVPENLIDQPRGELGFTLGTVRLAWRVNLETGKFEPFPTTGVQCFMELMGDF